MYQRRMSWDMTLTSIPEQVCKLGCYALKHRGTSPARYPDSVQVYEAMILLLIRRIAIPDRTTECCYALSQSPS